MKEDPDQQNSSNPYPTYTPPGAENVNQAHAAEQEAQPHSYPQSHAPSVPAQPNSIALPVV